MALQDVVNRDRRKGALVTPRCRPAVGLSTPATRETATSTETLEGPPQAVLDRKHWQRRYAGLLRLSDTAVVVGAVILGNLIRFGYSSPSTGAESRYASACWILIAAIWLLALAAFRTRSPRVIGVGLEEYRRIISASFAAFGGLAIVELILKLDISRGYLAVALPVGTLGMMLSRWTCRRYIAGRRVAGGYRTAVLAIGDRDAALHLAVELNSNAMDGYHVVGVCIPGYGAPRAETMAVAGHEIPIVGGESFALQAIRLWGADTVAVAGTGQFGIQSLRKFIWELEPMGVDLMVCPGVLDVALSRLVMRPVAGLPLLQIEKPQYRGAKRFQKRAFDSCFALVALTASLPILIIVALLIKLTSRGPVFYCSERIGIDAQPFSMLKFRTMVQGADQQFESLLAKNESDGLLFKIREDPRVTPVGRVLRRFSLDELPQFINVLRREMSVVGPRPPMRREVEAYDCDVLRRLLVKPGVTGLWQVSGRSDLSWDRSVRLDLAYVDNWSMVGDILIIGKTLRAVLQRKGAY